MKLKYYLVHLKHFNEAFLILNINNNFTNHIHCFSIEK